MTHDKIRVLPKDQVITYAKVVVDQRPQKEDSNRVQIRADGNLIQYKGNLSTRTADITTSKILWNSVLSTKNAKYMCLDIKNFYLTTALEYFIYMKMPLSLFPLWIREQYNMDACAHKGFVYICMERAVWGLPQAGILANKLLQKWLAPNGYLECINTPGLWQHTWRPIQFTLVVDNFGIKYVGKEHMDHLIQCIKEKYKLTKDWTGDLYCRIKLNWDYSMRLLDISMPRYVQCQLQKYNHVVSSCRQHCPYSPEPQKYGTDAQQPIVEDMLRKLNKKEIKYIQEIFRSILYYVRVVDMTVLMALRTIACKQTKGTEQTMEKNYKYLTILQLTQTLPCVSVHPT